MAYSILWLHFILHNVSAFSRLNKDLMSSFAQCPMYLPLIHSQTLLQSFNYFFSLFKHIKLSTVSNFLGDITLAVHLLSQSGLDNSLGLMHSSFLEIFFFSIFSWIPFVSPLYPIPSSLLVTSLFWWSASSSNPLRRVDKK